jgi:hypothetical protein
MTMESYQRAPQPWKVESVAPMRLKSGSRRFLKVSIMLVPSVVSKRPSKRVRAWYVPLLRRMDRWRRL